MPLSMIDIDRFSAFIDYWSIDREKSRNIGLGRGSILFDSHRFAKIIQLRSPSKI